MYYFIICWMLIASSNVSAKTRLIESFNIGPANKSTLTDWYSDDARTTEIAKEITKGSITGIQELSPHKLERLCDALNQIGRDNYIIVMENTDVAQDRISKNNSKCKSGQVKLSHTKSITKNLVMGEAIVYNKNIYSLISTDVKLYSEVIKDDDLKRGFLWADFNYIDEKTNNKRKLRFINTHFTTKSMSTPKQKEKQMDELIQHISYYKTVLKNIIVVGDFNMDYKKNDAQNRGQIDKLRSKLNFSCSADPNRVSYGNLLIDYVCFTSSLKTSTATTYSGFISNPKSKGKFISDHSSVKRLINFQLLQ